MGRSNADPELACLWIRLAMPGRPYRIGFAAHGFPQQIKAIILRSPPEWETVFLGSVLD